MSTDRPTTAIETTDTPASPKNTTPFASFWHTVLRFQADKLNVQLAVRNTIGVALALFGGVAFGTVSGGLAVTTGALNVSFSDTEAPYPQRARRMIAASILVGLAAFAGGVCGRNTPIAVGVATAWAFAAGMLVALSTTAADLGAMSLVTLVVYMALPLSMRGALYGGLLAFGGGMLQTGLALALWPLHRYGPERAALVSLYYELARAVSARVLATQAPPASSEATAAHAALATLTHRHSIEAERYRLLLSQAERMRLTLLLLARLRTRIAREDPASPVSLILDRFFDACSGLLRTIGDCILNGQPVPGGVDVIEDIESLVEGLRDLETPGESALAAMIRDARRQVDALAGQLRSAVDLANSATPEGFAAFERQEARRPWRLRLGGTVATLRANLNFNSAACRHAVRLAVCVGMGLAAARAASLQRSYWVPMTIAIVLKPDFTATFSRGVLRLGGTFGGLLLATALFHAVHPGMFGDAALIVAMMFLLRWIGPANYGVFVIAVTSLVVFLVSMTGVAPRPVMVARLVNTAAGGAIALLAYWLWPTWERTQVTEAFATMLDAYRASFRAVRESYDKGSGSGVASPRFDAARDRTRVASRLARSNLEASIDRLSAEPGISPDRISLLSGMLASSHRMVHAVMALEAGLYSGEAPCGDAFRTFANDVELTLYYMSAALRGSALMRETWPDLREDHHALLASGCSHLVSVETDRIVNSLNTLGEELSRWLA